MGAIISSSHDPQEVELYRQAERALLEDNHLLGILRERYIQFSNGELQRCGIKKTRVWEGGNLTPEGIPVVFVHGGGGTPLDFVPLLPHLLLPKKSCNPPMYRIICVERPGNGQSDPFDYRTCPMDVDQLNTCFLDAVLKELGITNKNNNTPVHLVANSMGGLCMFYALRYPHQVASVSFLGVPAGFQGMNLPFYFYILNSFIGELLFWYAPPFRFLTFCLLWIIFRIPYQNLSRTIVDNMWMAHRMRNNLLSFHSLIHHILVYATTKKGWAWEDIAQQDFSVLFIDAPGDPFINRYMRKRVAGCLVGKDRYLTLGQGHMPWIVEPKAFATALEDFWEASSCRNNKTSSTTFSTAVEKR